MPRKGRLDEIFSKALYADDASQYLVSYRDFDSIVDVPLPEFVMLSESFAVIPPSRITMIRRGDRILYRKYVSSR